MLIIMLTGYSKAGKDFVGSMLKDYYEWLGYRVEIEKFAKPLREFFTKELVEDKKDEKFNFHGIETTIRDLMIAISKGIKEEYSNNVFVEALINRINNKKDIDILIITDLRFTNEQKNIIKTFGSDNVLSIKVTREEEVEDKSQQVRELKFDFIYNNNDKKDFTKLISFIEKSL